MTVSRAFKKDATIKPDLRKKILKTAREMGYEPDRMVSELMTSFASRRPINYQETFAVLWHPERWAETSYESGYHLDMYNGLEAGAKMHGRKLDHIVMTEEMNGRVINRILKARNIQGIILTPLMHADETMPDLDWDHFSTVMLGDSMQAPNFNCAQASHYNVIVKTLEQLQARQYKRPCLLIHNDVDAVTYRSYTAAFLAWGHPLKHIWKADSYKSGGLSAWLDKVQPDVIVADWEIWYNTPPVEKAAIDFVALSVRSKNGPITGMHQNIISIAKSSVDLLVNARLQHEHGKPREPILILIAGTWVEGKTLRAPQEQALKDS